MARNTDDLPIRFMTFVAVACVGMLAGSCADRPLREAVVAAAEPSPAPSCPTHCRHKPSALR